MPITWILALLLWAAISKSQQLRKRLVISAFALLYLLANPFVSGLLVRAWEAPAVPMAELPQPVYEVGVVLGGVTDGARQPKDRVYTLRGADRVLHAATLYRKGHLRRILVTGGGVKYPEADDMRTLLIQNGVPDNLILVEDQSLNTRENAINSAPMLQKAAPGQPHLLITSAFHVRRAVGCFEKQASRYTPSPPIFTVDRGRKKGLLWPLQTIFSPMRKHLGTHIKFAGKYLVLSCTVSSDMCKSHAILSGAYYHLFLFSLPRA